MDNIFNVFDELIDDSLTESEKKHLAYQIHLFNKPEWINTKYATCKGGKLIVNEPFLIMELNRLVPYMENVNAKFHPLNMPHIKIGKVEIVGIVLHVKEEARALEILDDGTGSINIHYQKKYYDLDRQRKQNIYEKFQNSVWKVNQLTFGPQRKLVERFPKQRPGFVYPANTPLQKIAAFEQDWWRETRHGLLGKTIEPLDYIHASGYCSLDFLFQTKPKTEITFEHLSRAKLNFFGTRIDCISEEEYNGRMLKWMSEFVQKRYFDEASGVVETYANDDPPCLS